MRLIKNFLHNINDIVLAVIIVALAAGIIYWRMQIILDYPKQLANEQASYGQEQTEEAAPEEAPAEGNAEQAAEETQPAENAEQPAENAEQPAEEAPAEQPQG